MNRSVNTALSSLLIITATLLCLPFRGTSQIKETGLPFISNYSKSTYNASTQNWSIAQNSQGFLYFGNNDGLLEFDGQHWVTKALPAQTIVRSVLTVGDTIYTGSFEEIGYFSASGNGQLEYRSYVELIPKPYRKFDEVWKIHRTDFGIVFQSFRYIFVYNNNRINVIKPKSSFLYSFHLNNRLVVFDKETGMYELTPGGLRFMFNHPVFQRDEVRCVMELSPGKLLIGTFTSGVFVFDGKELYPWDDTLNRFLIEYGLFTGIKLSNGFYAFGTVRNGLYIADLKGVIFQQITRQKGLQNNTILSLFEDKRHNLWLGLDNGIDYIELNSPLSIYNYTYNLESTYAAIAFEDKLYVGTNQGLYASELKNLTNRNLNNSFSLIKGTEGQVWSLTIIDNKLLCGHNYGCFQIENGTAVRISDTPGFWKIIEYNGSSDTLLAGTYNGLVLLLRKNNTWKDAGKIKGFTESCRFLEQDRDGSIWVAHGYRGLFHLILSDDLTTVKNSVLYDKGHGLPGKFPYNLNKIDDEILISTPRGFYAFNKDRQQFVSQGNYNEIFRNQEFISEISKDASGNLWYFSLYKTGVNRLLEDGSFNNIEIPFYPINSSLLPTFESIYLHDDKNIFIGSQNGLIHYNPELTVNYRQTDPVYIRQATFPDPENPVTIFLASGNHQLLRSAKNDSVRAEIPYKNNSVTFSFTSPCYEQPGSTLFSYRLTGFDDNWSEWDKNSFKEYTNLREGIYTFEVRAMNAYHATGEASRFTFRIKPPFHRSVAAYSIYSAFLVILLIGNIYFQKRRIEKTRASELQKHEKELNNQVMQFREQTLIQEKEIINLRNETLINEMNHKNKELANSTLNLLHKNKILTTLKLQLSDLLQKAGSGNDHKHEIASLVRKINRELSNEKHQEAFNAYFDEVHQDFLKRLKDAHPELSPKDLRLCAYLRMNLSTKEISPLMNISVRGVEISRYRLRKKLQLEREANLTDYILNF
ncbi:MAG: hypothetical protein JNL22_12185 [Bacteroidales bacterium]|jgi:ligand-binding sensor domain-containing protein/DNA-binding CsgD family transcriptional regulator|nr:hypothetical protein [Bacteroidales bacterium]